MNDSATPRALAPMRNWWRAWRHAGCTALLCAALAGCGAAPVTGRSQLLLVPEDYAIEASGSAYLQMLGKPAKEGKLDTDPALTRRVERITGRLVAQAVVVRPETAKWDWSIHVVDDPKTVNAWAMAGGRMALYSGLVTQLEPSDDELAQVLGHEIAHALARHTAEQMSVALAGNAALLAVAASTERSEVVQAASLAAVLALQLPYSRKAESEADRIGIELAARAGYDPNAAVTLWRKMDKAGGSRPPEFLSTHPGPDTRRRALARLVERMMPLYEAPGERPVYPLKSTPIPSS